MQKYSCLYINTMVIKDRIWKQFRGILFFVFLFYSTYFGTIFLITPILPLFFVIPKYARCVTDVIIWWWKIYFVVSISDMTCTSN